MSNKIKLILKNNRFLYRIYVVLFNFIFKVLRIFIHVDDNVILINSFAGRKYDDSPKVIYEYMITQKKYDKYKLYWNFDNPERFEIKRGEKLKTNSFKYFIIALKAKYWITNSSIERGLQFKNKRTIYINTWHGSAIKKMGKDVGARNYKFKSSRFNYMYAQSEYDVEIFSHAFNIEKGKFVLAGLPRNDELVDVKDEEIMKIKQKLNLPLDKKIILYAPTFREFECDKNGCVITSKLNLEYWKKELSENYIVLFRAHYEVNKSLNIINNGFIYDYSSYENLNELMKISDMLISDYSSIMIDYSILERPIYCYAYDYKEYMEKRGVYLDLKSDLPNGYYESEEELIKNIKNCNYEEQKYKTIKFKNKYVSVCGDAKKYIDNIIRG